MVLTRPQSARGIAQTDLTVNSWAANLPTPAAVRPPRCPACGLAAHRPDGTLALHGHGTRARTLRHCHDATAAPTDVVLTLRRYRCTHCGAVTLVGPRGLLPRRRYTVFAIVLAFAAWITLDQTARAVRAAFSPIPFASHSHVAWRAMARWVDAITAGRLLPCIRGSPPAWSRRQRAERALSRIRAMAPPTERTTIVHEVFAGAFHAALAQ